MAKPKGDRPSKHDRSKQIATAITEGDRLIKGDRSNEQVIAEKHAVVVHALRRRYPNIAKTKGNAMARNGDRYTQNDKS